MADLSKLTSRGGSQDQASYRRDGFGSRRQTDAPGLEVNARVGRPNTSGAEQLQKILGLAGDTATAFADSMGRKQEEDNKKLMGQASLDAAIGAKNEDQYVKSKEYRRAFDFERGKAGAIELDQNLTTLIQDRLNNTDDPADITDIVGLIDDAYMKYALGPYGKPRDFGSPEANLAVADQLEKTRARLVGSSMSIIKDQVEEKTLSTVAQNVFWDRTQALQAPLTGTGVPGSPIPPTATSPGTTIADTRKFATAKNGFVTSAELRDVFGQEKGIRISSGSRSTARNKAVNGVANSQHIGKDDQSSTALDMVGVTPNRARAILAANGLTGEIIQHDAGSGMHVHIESVRQTGATPEEVKLTPAENKPLPTRSEPIDFEAILARVPSSIDRGKAKKYLLGAAIQYADENGDDKYLDGLWQSKRKDGTPSFNPDEIKALRDERDRIREQRRVETERLQRKTWSDNADIILTSEVNDKPASEATIRQWVNEGRLDPQFGLTLLNSRESEARAEQRMATAEAREAARNAETDLDIEIASEAELIRSGATRGAGLEDLQRRYAAGELGQGRRAASRFKSLLAAARQGEQAAMENPERADYAERINRVWAKPKVAGNSRVQAALGIQDGDPKDYRPAIMAEFNRLIKQGETPAWAYEAAVAKYGPEKNATVRRFKQERAAELRRRATAGR